MEFARQGDPAPHPALVEPEHGSYPAQPAVIRNGSSLAVQHATDRRLRIELAQAHLQLGLIFSPSSCELGDDDAVRAAAFTGFNQLQAVDRYGQHDQAIEMEIGLQDQLLIAVARNQPDRQSR